MRVAGDKYPQRVRRSLKNVCYLQNYTQWVNTEHFDLIVIGSGPAGEKGAAQAVYFNKRVAVIERAANVGGARTNTGALPSKTLRETALYFSGVRQCELYGIDYSLKEHLRGCRASCTASKL